MSIQLDVEHKILDVLPDCDGERAKRTAVFIADLFSPGVTMPADLEPHNWKEVQKPLAGDVSPEVMQRVCAMAGVEVRF